MIAYFSLLSGIFFCQDIKKLFYGWIIVLGGVLIGAATNLLNSIANVVIGLVSEDFSVPRTMFNLATVISMPVVMVLSPERAFLLPLW